MLNSSAQELVRELIVETDHLSRTSHEASEHTLSGRLAALRTTLQHVERVMGGESPRFAVMGELDVIYQRIRDLASAAKNDFEKDELAHLLEHAERLRAHRVTLPYPSPLPLVRRTRGPHLRRREQAMIATAGLVALAAIAFAGWRRLYVRRAWS